MKAHLVTRPACPPHIVTVERDARDLARFSTGGKSEPIEVPDTKLALVPWLNDRLFRAFQEGSNDGAREAFREAAEISRAGDAGADKAGTCPACQRSAAGAAATAASLLLTEIEEQIHAANGWMLARILDAAIGRLGELQREAARLGESA